MNDSIDVNEEKKILEYLKENGIKTLEQLEAIVKPTLTDSQKVNWEVNSDDDLQFINVVQPGLSKEKLTELMEESDRNKEKLLMHAMIVTAEASKLPEQNNGIVQQNGIVADTGHIMDAASSVSVVNAVTAASGPKKNATPLPMRYRHKHNQLINLFPKPTRSQQQQEKKRQANPMQESSKKMAIGAVNIQYNQYNQCSQYNSQSQLSQSTQNQRNQCTRNQVIRCTRSHLYQCSQYNPNHQQSYNANNLNLHTYQGAGRSIATGYNNGTGYNDVNGLNNGARLNHISGYNNANGFSNTTGYGTLGHTIPVTQSLRSTPVYNTLAQQQWSAATPMAHTGQCYNNFGQCELGSQIQPQQSCSQYMMANRPIFDPN